MYSALRKALNMFRLSSLILKCVKLCLCRHGVQLTKHVQIWAAGVDKTLTPQGLISPGLGDTVRTQDKVNTNHWQTSYRVTGFSRQSWGSLAKESLTPVSHKFLYFHRHRERLAITHRVLCCVACCLFKEHFKNRVSRLSWSCSACCRRIWCLNVISTASGRCMCIDILNI